MIKRDSWINLKFFSSWRVPEELNCFFKYKVEDHAPILCEVSYTIGYKGLIELA